MSIVHSHAAGVDIGAEFHVVAVPPDGCLLLRFLKQQVLM